MRIRVFVEILHVCHSRLFRCFVVFTLGSYDRNDREKIVSEEFNMDEFVAEAHTNHDFDPDTVTAYSVVTGPNRARKIIYLCTKSESLGLRLPVRRSERLSRKLRPSNKESVFNTLSTSV